MAQPGGGGEPVRVRNPACGGAFGQIGYQDIQPIVLLNDPYFSPSSISPYGEHWLHTTKMTYTWRLVGYDQPYTVDHDNPNRTIAFIDTGIDMDYPEFGGDTSTAYTQ